MEPENLIMDQYSIFIDNSAKIINLYFNTAPKCNYFTKLKQDQAWKKVSESQKSKNEVRNSECWAILIVLRNNNNNKITTATATRTTKNKNKPKSIILLVIKRDVLQHVIIRHNILVKNDTLVFLNLLLDFCSWRKGNLNRQFHANMHVNNLFIYLGVWVILVKIVQFVP